MGAFGEFILKARFDEGLTQQELAKKLRVSATYIYQLEKGKIDPPPKRRCIEISTFLQIPPEKLWELASQERLAKFYQREGLDLKIRNNKPDSLSEIAQRKNLEKRVLIKNIMQELEKIEDSSFLSILFELVNTYQKKQIVK